jgi:hypothetical protein
MNLGEVGMTALEDYLRSLSEDHRTGEAVAETAGYGALQTLLNSVGETLSPRVRTVINTKNRGAGIPDGGLFAADQFERRESQPIPGQIPERGAIEVKGPNAEVRKVAASDQVARYLTLYGQVLVTNYREFLLVERGSAGQVAEVDFYSLAGSRDEFWRAAASPRSTAAQHEHKLSVFLKRVMLRGAPLLRPRDLAWFMASYAQEALAILDEGELPELDEVRTTLERALGVDFEGESGEHFFRSTLVQTLFYGVFSAWVLWSNQRPPDSSERFDWRTAMYIMNVPMIGALFEQLAMPSRVEGLGLMATLDRAGETLNRVERQSFFETFDEDGAVQYFYEPFLEAFDPEVRKQFGVWYTPREVVRYMVKRVDTALREELHLDQGLANESVYVLDPCTGTGSFLVEVLRKIRRNLEDRGEGSLAAYNLKRAATERVFGFEILAAPFVIAHLQLGRLLQEAGAPLSETRKERAAVYLTNALTGWSGSKDESPLPIKSFQRERLAAGEVKLNRKVLVVLGNPPYDGFAGMGAAEERDLSEAYSTTERAPAPRGQGRNDLYVRFFRMAERQIVERRGRGVVCFISNSSWLEHLSFPGMRERYLKVFDEIWIDNLNGDRYRTGKRTPDGTNDPSIFSTKENPEGIQVGTAISLLVRKEPHESTGTVRLRNLWGTRKREELASDSERDPKSLAELYEEQTPPLELGLPFAPLQAQADYPAWPKLADLFRESYPGVTTSRDEALVDMNRDALIERMELYFDRDTTDEEVEKVMPAVMKDTGRFDAKRARETLVARGFLPANVVRYAYRPFDVRWLYWEPVTKLLDRNRASYFPQVFEKNPFLFTTGRVRKSTAEPALSTYRLCDYNYMDSGARGFPLYLRPPERDFTQSAASEEAIPNLTEAAVDYLSSLGAAPEDLFYHCLSTMHSLAYRWENNDSLRLDWPRIPLPRERDVLVASGDLGRKISALLDVESKVDGVTAGNVRSELRLVGRLTRKDDGQIDPDAGHLRVTAGWGYRQENNRAIKGGQGKLTERGYTSDERAALLSGAEALGLSEARMFARLGKTTFDIYMNDGTYWRNVPSKVWSYTMGGYPVIKKWLSYREEKVLGRSLEVNETLEVTSITRRITALLLLEEDLDESYSLVKESTRPEPQAQGN